MASNQKINSTVDEAEIAKFSAMAEEWWDESGKFKPLHRFNPVRIKFIRDKILEHFNQQPQTNNQQPLNGFSLLDIGCGGGLMCEPLARMGANITGIDASDKNIKIAQLHASGEQLSINYICTSAEQMPQENLYDCVLAMEIIEHVADVPSFVKACTALVKPGGLLFFATMNRTMKSFALAIVGAEYILRWLPRGTHDWKKFLKPSEIAVQAEALGLSTKNVQGVSFNPINQQWSLSDDTAVNYILVLEKPNN